MNEPLVTLELAHQHGLTEEEYNEVLKILGRTPTFTELGIFSVMWSEHCSYKNSIAELKKLPRSGKHLLVQAGEENAGLVDIGDGLAVAFKIESHNHPSAVEPYQGAATGVGGIMRDVFSMGVRPIAALNSLRFGSLNNPQTRYLIKGVVKGIADYGNSFGVPTVAGDIYFEECYNENPLVNVMAVGIVEHDEVVRAVAKGEGNVVMIVGSATGRDGIHGATFASEEISEKSESKRPSVQVGDPFTEKLLLEAILEATRSGYIIGIQDMGAAGITCSTSEMSARGKSGMVIDLDKVPLREQNMTGYEIMLSESQERMLLIVSPENTINVQELFQKWDLRCETIGVVTSDGQLKIKKEGKIIADIPAQSLVLGGSAPVYYRESIEPEYIKELRSFDLQSLPKPEDYNDCLLKLLGSPNIASKRWVYTQYDMMVRTNTLIHTNSDAAVIRIKGTNKALAFKTDCNSRYSYLNPYRGAQIAVAESARNVVCVGAKPIAITNCLNFGNPYKPEIFWQFKETVRGIAEACRVLETPVTGGNVSFYNENPTCAIYPTPVIGMLGLVETVDFVTSPDFKNEGDAVILLGELCGGIDASEYLKIYHGKICGDTPNMNLETEKKLQMALLEMIHKRLVHSAHDVSEGGLAIALAECCIYAKDQFNQLGVNIKVELGKRADFTLFSEGQSRVVISCSPEYVRSIKSVTAKHGIGMQIIGIVTNDNFSINNLINVEVEEMREHYNTALERRLKELILI